MFLEEARRDSFRRGCKTQSTPHCSAPSAGRGAGRSCTSWAVLLLRFQSRLLSKGKRLGYHVEEV